MNVNVAQAAEFLGVSKAKVKSFIEHGFLKDQKERVAGKKKHYARVDQKELRAFRSSDEFKLLKLKRYVGGYVSGHGNGNDNGKHIEVDSTIKLPSMPLTGITSRLDGLEAKVNEINAKFDQLLALWA